MGRALALQNSLVQVSQLAGTRLMRIDKRTYEAVCAPASDLVNLCCLKSADEV